MVLSIRRMMAAAGVVFFLGGGAMLASDGGDKPWGERNAIVRKVPTEQKVVALTFDDGPHPLTTRQLLAVLKEKGIRATFFVLGSSVEQYRDLMKEIVAEGHEIASHSYNHEHLNRISKERAISEVQKAEEVIGVYAPKPGLFRPPGGGYNDWLVKELKHRGYSTVLWTIDPRDWDQRSPAQVVDMVTRKAEPGAIILLHEGKCAVGTPGAVAEIADRLAKEGYRFVTVGELMQFDEKR